MTCYYPNTAHVSGFRETGTKIIAFGLPKDSNQESFDLPCGQCTGCRLDYAQTWAVRSMHENQLHENSSFITLTYNDENIPYDGSLCPPHFTKFIKRLRKNTATKIRYLMCGEYGPSVGKRPHYHALLFGWDAPDKYLWAENEGIPTYTSELLQSIWKMGFCTVQDITLASAAYVARYALKKVKIGKNSEDKHHAHYETICPITGEIRQALPEYARMSNRPGLALDWYTKYHSDIFPHDTTIYKGKNIKTPRYYENLLRSTDLPTFEEIKENRRQQAILHLDNNTPSRLRVREKILNASLGQLNRTLHQ